MKKTYALLLALIMLITTNIASSETLEIRMGTPSACPLETFRLSFETTQKEAGSIILWNENPVNYNDYMVYSGLSEDETTAIMIYTMNDCIACATVLGQLTIEYNDQASAEKLSSWLSTAISGMTFGFYVGENRD